MMTYPNNDSDQNQGTFLREVREYMTPHPVLPPKRSRKRYVKGEGYCEACRRLVKPVHGRCPVCLKRTIKVEDTTHNLLMVHASLPLNHVYLEDGRAVDRDSGEIFSTQVLDRSAN